MKEIIRLENAVKMVNGSHRVINNVDLRICEKESASICGVPGSGKQMLMRLIAGMEVPSDGRVVVLGHAVHTMGTDEAAVFRNRNIGIVHRHPGFLPQLSVLDNVAMPLAVQGTAVQKRKQAAKEMLQSFGVAHIACAYPYQLSAYEMLIASAARALITQPKILLMYEAVAGLPERDKARFAGLMNVMLHYGAYTILSFSANPINGVDRTIMLEDGKIQEDRS